MSTKFEVGQRVAVLRDQDRVVDGIHKIEKITHNGTRIRVEGRPLYTFNRFGHTSGLTIVPATAEHEEALERKRLFGIIDKHLGTDAGWTEKKQRRTALSTETLRKVAELFTDAESGAT